jgi:hypothetical protein
MEWIMIRCNKCDFVLDNVGPQSNFFNSLPDEERSKRRVRKFDPITKTFSVSCAGCAGPLEASRRALDKDTLLTLAEKENAPTKPYTREELNAYVEEYYKKQKKS